MILSPTLFSIPMVYFSLPLLIFFQAEFILSLYTLSSFNSTIARNIIPGNYYFSTRIWSPCQRNHVLCFWHSLHHIKTWLNVDTYDWGECKNIHRIKLDVFYKFSNNCAICPLESLPGPGNGSVGCDLEPHMVN